MPPCHWNINCKQKRVHKKGQCYVALAFFMNTSMRQLTYKQAPECFLERGPYQYQLPQTPE